MTLVNANPQAQAAGHDELPGKSNYFIGDDPAKWRTNIPTYAKVKYEGVYPGVDLIYYGNQRQLEYDFVVAPGADPGVVTLAFEGARSVHIDARGELVLGVEGGELRQHAPLVYQEIAGVKQEVAGRYVMTGKRQVGFRVAAYDPGRPLIIDPVLVYSTYLGGSAFDWARGIAVDGAGSAYVTGQTFSANFPTTSGAAQMTKSVGADAFVTKLDATGSVLVYSTYLGGSSFDFGRGIAVDGAGSAYVAGDTSSTDFPTTTGAAQPTNGGGNDAFVTKLDATGSLLYSTYLGGSSSDYGLGIAVDGAGRAYVPGFTLSTDFPTTSGADQPASAGSADAFVTKLNATGSALLYSTYLGGSNNDYGYGIAVDGAGSAYVTGQTYSIDFPTTSGTFAGSADAFVTKLKPDGSALLYSTYLGGSGSETGYGIAVEGAGSAYVTGQTLSIDFPTTAGAAQTMKASGADAFVAKLNVTGSALVYSTYLGGSAGDVGQGIAMDGAGNVYVTGYTSSTNFPTTAGAAQATNGGFDDAFVTKLDATGSALVYSTYLGGASSDYGYGIAVDGAGSAYLAGQTISINFPTTAGAAQAFNGGAFDAFVAKIEFVGPPATLALSPAVATNPVGSQHCVTATVQDAFGNPSPDITVRFTVTGTTTTSGSGTTDGSGQTTFCYVGPTSPGADAITAYSDTNDNTTQDPGEPGGAAAKTWVAGAPATLTLSPATATNPVNTQHCVTATVQDAFANPTPGETVRFSVTGAVATSGSAMTDANGQASFCYTGPSVAGADAIAAYADTNNNGTADVGEPSGAASKTWFVPLPTSTDQCKNGGWKTFGVFKNQGDCVSFVSTKGKNPPSLP